jgi:hypothetical protein
MVAIPIASTRAAKSATPAVLYNDWKAASAGANTVKCTSQLKIVTSASVDPSFSTVVRAATSWPNSAPSDVCEAETSIFTILSEAGTSVLSMV